MRQTSEMSKSGAALKINQHTTVAIGGHHRHAVGRGTDKTHRSLYPGATGVELSAVLC